MKNLSIVLLILLFLPLTVYAQSNEAVPITRITEPITLDGMSDEQAWANVDPFPMVIHEPIFGAVPTERTEMLAVYDDDYIYFAMRGYDSDPDGIRGNVLIRDRFGSDDYLK